MKTIANRSELGKLVIWVQRIGAAIGDDTCGIKLEMSTRSGQREHISDYPLRGGQSESELEAFAELVFQRAFDEAEGSGNGLHCFVARAFQGEREFNSTRFKIPVSSAPEDPRAEVGSSTLLGQAYAHLEARERLSVEKDNATYLAFGTVIELMTRRLESSERADVERQRAATEQLAMFRDLLTQRVNLDLEVEERKEARDIRQKLLEPMLEPLGQIAPVIAGKIVGKLMGGEEGKSESEPPAPALPATVSVQVEAPRAPDPIVRRLRGPRRVR